MTMFKVCWKNEYVVADYTVFRKKTPTHVFFYISVENVSIYTKISGCVYEELSILRT